MPELSLDAIMVSSGLQSCTPQEWVHSTEHPGQSSLPFPTPSKQDPACQPLLFLADSSEPQRRQILLLVFLPEACGMWEEVCSKEEMVTLLHPVMVKGNSRVQLLQSEWFLNTWY